MGISVNKLIEIGSEPFLAAKPDITSITEKYSELLELLQCKNGFFAFESALRVFPSGNCDYSYGLIEWNSDKLWINHYGDLAKNCFFFAEDIYGGQFCFSNSKVYYFEPEMGELVFFANSLEEWAAKILKEYDTFTGHAIAHEWQSHHGTIGFKNRLLPKTFFVLGGKVTLENLIEVEASYGMRVRGPIAQQIHSLPDGTQIELKVADWEPTLKDKE